MIFIDTWAWNALSDRTDQYQGSATSQHDKHLAARRRYVTSDFVLAEFINYLYTSILADDAASAVELIFQQAESGMLDLVHLSADQFQRAWQLRKKYHDKPSISFIDFTSFIVMRDLRISDVFTGDAHFEQVGMGFHLVP